MAVILPAQTPYAFNQGANQLVAGSVSVASILLNVPPPATSSITPGHGLGLTNANKMLTIKSDVNGLKLAGGAVAVKASLLVDLAGFVYDTTYSEIEIPVRYNSSTRSIHLGAKATPSSTGAVVAGSAAAGAYLTELVTTFTAALANTGPTLTHPYHSSNPNDSDGDIALILGTYFAAAGDFSIVANQLLIQAGAVGVNGNNIKILSRTLPSLPSPLPDILPNGIPDFEEGEVIHAGIQDDTSTDSTVATVEIKGSNAYGAINILTTDITDAGKIKLFITRNPEFLRALVRSGVVTYDATRNIYSSTNEASTAKIGLFLSIKSKDVKATQDAVWYYDCVFDGAITQETSLRGVAGYTLNLKLQQDLERSGDPRFVRWNVRRLA